MNNNFEMCVRAIIQENGKILVCKAKTRDYYFFPGGHVDFGETAKDTLKRELKEELDTTIKEISFIGAIENIFTEDGVDHHEINLAFDVRVENVKYKSREDHLDFSFLDIEQFAKEKVLPIALRDSIVKWFKDKEPFWSTQTNEK